MPRRCTAGPAPSGSIFGRSRTTTWPMASRPAGPLGAPHTPGRNPPGRTTPTGPGAPTGSAAANLTEARQPTPERSLGSERPPTRERSLGSGRPSTPERSLGSGRPSTPERSLGLERPPTMGRQPAPERPPTIERQPGSARQPTPGRPSASGRRSTPERPLGSERAPTPTGCVQAAQPVRAIPPGLRRRAVTRPRRPVFGAGAAVSGLLALRPGPLSRGRRREGACTSLCSASRCGRRRTGSRAAAREDPQRRSGRVGAAVG